MSTLENFRTRLGLKSPAEFSTTVPSRLQGLGRRLGRTTEMLLEALVHLAETGNDVNIVAVNRTIADELVKKAQGYAKTLGLDPTKIKTRQKSCFEASIGLPASPRVFVDHAVSGA
jgi:hypothetical protein